MGFRATRSYTSACRGRRGEKSRASLKFLTPVPARRTARDDIEKAIDAPSSTRSGIQLGTGRNIRTQFLYDNSIYPSTASALPRARAKCIVLHRNARRTDIRICIYLDVHTYIPVDLPEPFILQMAGPYSPILPGIAGSIKESYRSFREFILRAPPKRAASRRFMKVDRSDRPPTKFRA